MTPATALQRPVRILCFSRNQRLLETRLWVLASRYEVVPVQSVEEMEGLAQPFDVLLLCHTLSAEECDRSLGIARRKWPHAKILAVSAEDASCSAYADQVVRGLEGPRVLFNSIDRLVAAA